MLALAERLVIGDGKTVRLITHPLQQEEGRRIDREDDSILAPRTIKPLVAVAACASGLVHLQAALRDADHFQVDNTQFVQGA